MSEPRPTPVGAPRPTPVGEQRPTPDGEPWLTVVTVVRNDLPALRRTIASVRDQQAPGVEHLIVDGASEDGTWAAAQGAARADARVRAVSEPDSGIYDAMNKGLRLARGRLVQYLNAGDVYSGPDELAWVAAQAGGAVSWLRTRVQFVDAAGRPTRPLRPARIDLAGFRRGRQDVFHQGAYMDRRLLAGLGGFDTGLRLVADYDLMLRALQRGEQPLVRDRVTVLVDAGGVSTLQWRRALRELHVSRTRGAGRWRTAASRVGISVRTAEVGVRRSLRGAAEAVLGEARVSRWRARSGGGPS